MPSKQVLSTGDNLSIYERAFHDDYDIDPVPLLRGIQSYKTALRAHQAIHDYGGRGKHKEHIAAQLQEYRD